MAGDLEANGAGASSTTTNGDTSGAIHEGLNSSIVSSAKESHHLLLFVDI